MRLSCDVSNTSKAVWVTQSWDRLQAARLLFFPPTIWGKVHLRTPPTPWDETCLTLVTSLCYCTAQMQKPLVRIWWWNLTRPPRRAFRYSTPPIPSPLQTSVGGRQPSLRSTARLGVAEKLAECIRTLGKCFALADGRMPLAHSLGQQSDLVELMSLRWLIEPQSLGCQPFDRVHLQREKGRKGDNREILFRLVKCP